MDQTALARANYTFFFADLALACLLTDTFAEQCQLGARRAANNRDPDKNDYADADWNIQIQFKCNNGEFGYLAFTVADAARLVRGRIDSLNLATKMSASIVGEINDTSEFKLNGVYVSFKIVLYKGDPDGMSGCVVIRNPIGECPNDDTPLGRKVQMRVTRE